MISNIITHPSIALIIGAILIYTFKGRGNYISIISLLVSLIILIIFTGQKDLIFTTTKISIHYFLYSNLSFLFCLVFLLIGVIGKVFSIYNNNDNEKALILIYIASAIAVIFSGDFLTLYVFWEIMAIASTFIIWSSSSIHSGKAGQRYLIMHMFGGLILLFGIIGLYLDTNNLAIRIINLESWYSWLILAGLLLNAGAPPFSQWISDAYPEGSYSSTVFLSAYTTKTSVFVLIMTFAGNYILILLGIYMIMYGIIYALLENDIRRILSYSIVNQVGFMIVGIGIGTELSINGTAAHAFSHIIYKGLLLMSAGSVIYMTGKRKCSDVGGLYKTMPITAACGIIGALSISAFPLTSGFISKSMIIDASYHQNLEIIWLLLLVGSAGVFLHAGIKFPWFVFFHKDQKIDTKDPPIFMKGSMIAASAICIILGMMPNLLYEILPYKVNYIPYTGNHVVSQLHLLLFSALAFFISLKYLKRTQTITLDIDWFYRNKLEYMYKAYNYISKILFGYVEKINLGLLKNKFEIIEGFLLKQITISNMLTLILITLFIFLALNI